MTPNWSALAQDVLDVACRLQQIPAPTFHEDQRAQQVSQVFAASALVDVQRDHAGNVLARFPGTGDTRPLVLSAHLDTVFPVDFPLTLSHQRDRISGPGIGDNSLGVAGLVTLPHILSAAEVVPGGDVWLVATTGEEGLGDLRGMQAVVERFGSQPVGYISIEGMGFGTILHRGLGVQRYRVCVSTRGGHSWVDYGSPSAIHELVTFAARLSDHHLPRKPRSTLNIGTIQGGTSVNTIAAQAWMDIDLRCENARGLQEICSYVKHSVENASRKGVNFTIELIGARAAGELPRDHALVRLAADALSAQGVIPEYDIASTEANAALGRGFPALTVGLTTGDHAHSGEEYIDKFPLLKGLAQLAYLVEHAWE